MTKNEPQKPFQWWPPTREQLHAYRDIAFFLVALAGVINELFIAGTKDAGTIALCGGLAGLPGILNKSGEGK